MKKKENLPALDSMETRRIQQERFLKSSENMGEGLKEIGDYVKETKKYNKINLYLSLIFFSIIIGLIVGGLVYVNQDGNIKDVFVSREYTRKITCETENKTIELRTFKETTEIQQAFPNTKCKIQ